MNLKLIEAELLKAAAGFLAANKATVLADLAPLNGVAAADVLAIVDHVLPPMIRVIVQGFIKGNEGQLQALLAQEEGQVVDALVAFCTNEAAALAA